MAGGSWLLLFECAVEAVFITSGYARSASFNSLLTGLGVDVLCNYVFVYRWRWGVRGAALAWSAVRPSRPHPSPNPSPEPNPSPDPDPNPSPEPNQVRASRLLVWAGLAAWFRLFRPFFVPRTREPLLCRKEVRPTLSLALSRSRSRTRTRTRNRTRTRTRTR